MRTTDDSKVTLLHVDDVISKLLKLQNEILHDSGPNSKCTFAVRITGIGSPFRYVGSYRHCLTQSMAAGISNGWPEMTLIASTVPSDVSVASKTTVPVMRALIAS